MRKLFYLLPIIVVFSGCTRSPVPVNGQIFIVTKGQQNIKLGLVEVRAIPEAEAKKEIAKRLDLFKANALKMLPDYRRTKKEKDAATAKKDELLDNYNETVGIYEILSDAKDVAKKKKAIRDASDLVYELELTEVLYRGMIYDDAVHPRRMKDWPQGVMAKSDADGRFTLLLKPGRYMLVASSSRYTGAKDESEEQYYWFPWVDVVKPSVSIFLSNDNLYENCKKDECGLDATRVDSIIEKAP